MRWTCLCRMQRARASTTGACWRREDALCAVAVRCALALLCCARRCAVPACGAGRAPLPSHLVPLSLATPMPRDCCYCCRCRCCCRELLRELVDRVRTAVALPVRIDIKDSFDATCTELTITADIGGWVGGRGGGWAGGWDSLRRRRRQVRNGASWAVCCSAD